MNSVFKKELRDCLRWAPLGMVLGLVQLWMARPTAIHEATMMEINLISYLGLAAGLIAIALGLLQSLFDTRNDSRGYLLHRPIETREIFWGKIAAGYVAYMIALAVPVLIAMAYLQVKGIEHLPTNAWQIIPFLLYSFVIFLLHPTMLWVANRDARWVGSRLLPTVGAISLVFVLMQLLAHGSFDSFFASMAFGLAVFAALASVTLIASRHAFVHQSQLPPRSSVHWRSIVGMVGLVFSSVVLYGVSFAFLCESVSPTPQEYITYTISMSDQGEWQQIKTRLPGGYWNAQENFTRNIDGKGEFTKVSKDWKQAHSSLLNRIHSGHNSPLSQFHWLGLSESENVTHGSVYLVEHRGRILLYEDNGKLVEIVTPVGSFKDMSEAKGAFDGLAPLSQLHGYDFFSSHVSANPLLFDNNGVYQLDANALRVHKLIDGKVASAMLLMEGDENPASLWTLSHNRLTRHDIASKNPDLEMPQADSTIIKKTQQFSLPPIEIIGSHSYPLDPLNDRESLRVLRTPEGQYAMIRSNSTTREAKYAMLTENDSGETLGSVTLPETQTGRSEYWPGLALPPAPLAILAAIQTFFFRETGPNSPMGIYLAIVGHAALAAIATWCLSGRLSLSRRERTLWTIIGALLGFGVLVGMISIYPKPIKGGCPRCRKPRRIDLELCEHCAQPWDPPPEDGVEIFERDLSLDAVRASSLS